MIWSRRKRKDSHTPEEGDWSAFIEKGANFEGDLKFQGNLRIDGCFKGKVEGGGALIVGVDADLHSNISVFEIVVYGEIRGNIRADSKIDIDSSGKVFGDIQAPDIVIRDGAVLEGKCLTTRHASLTQTDVASDEGENGLLRLGSISSEMREMQGEDVLLSRLQLLIIMCLACLKDYPVGQFRKDAIVANANYIIEYCADLPVNLKGIKGNEQHRGTMDFKYILCERIRLLALMAKGFAEGNMIGRFRRQAAEENIDCIYDAIKFTGQLNEMKFPRLV
ncbi:MAG: polymer-forming cytoskeletal protein [Deltaproteobacteria bacterium]|nr:polymer-forming cytoskeletal protein [Deltaproteobacteria bacterium]